MRSLHVQVVLTEPPKSNPIEVVVDLDAKSVTSFKKVCGHVPASLIVQEPISFCMRDIMRHALPQLLTAVQYGRRCQQHRNHSSMASYRRMSVAAALGGSHGQVC